MVAWAVVRKASWTPYALCQKSYCACFTAPFWVMFCPQKMQIPQDSLG